MIQLTFLISTLKIVSYRVSSVPHTAEILADKFSISRREQDEYAFQSQKRAKMAIESGLFVEEIVPVTLPKTGEQVSQDEFPQLNCTLEGLGKLRPAFRRTEVT